MGRRQRWRLKRVQSVADEKWQNRIFAEHVSPTVVRVFLKQGRAAPGADRTQEHLTACDECAHLFTALSTNNGSDIVLDYLFEVREGLRQMWTAAERRADDEVTVSGAARVRPELARMLADAHAGKFQAVVTWSLDRLSRRGIAELSSITAKLDCAGVALVSVKESWCDTSGPVRDLLVSVMAWVAAQERARLSERTRAGLDRARAQGIKLGRPCRHPALIEAGLRRVASGESFSAVARDLGIGATTLRRRRRANTS